jgi:beta-galactosidase/beta-glucuronidase
MNRNRWPVAWIAGLALVAGQQTASAQRADTSLPSGVKAVWDLDKAYRESTATRQRVCLNGLWRWQPARETSDTPPSEKWGYFKVPGFWPGATSYDQEDCQTLYGDPSWKNADLRGITAAWYQREITVPDNWSGRRIVLGVEYLNSYAAVYVDGKKAGEGRFPAGEVDVTDVCRPGSKHVLSLLVVALPLKGVMLSYSDTNAAKAVQGSVSRRGLCGDVYLVSVGKAAHLSNLKIDTSVRKGEITVRAGLDGLTTERRYTLRVSITESGNSVREFTSAPFKASDLKEGKIAVTEKWRPEKLWDIHTPQHVLNAHVSLVDADGKVLDIAYPVHFGFREMWIDGRDFYLNGTRIYLSAVPLDNALLGARTATYESTVETLKRLRSFGINFVYTHNYGCQPGSHVSYEEILKTADDAGMLVAFSQPHFGHYDWKAPNADQANGYAKHAEFYVRVAQNHPSVVAYSMSHNATGYDEDMNPDRIGTSDDPRADGGGRNNAALALRAESIVKALDPSRIVYHHSSGNLSAMHTCNFYLNFVPIQELSDWFETWATRGIKPAFLCEYGVPFSWDWTMYRGWYKGQRSFGSAQVPWEFCLAEWNAQFLGDRAYRIGEREKRNLRWEAGQFRAGNLWHRWDYPTSVGASDFDDRQEVFARYLADNWRAHRTWGLSANSPWEYSAFWKLREGVNKRKEFKTDWDSLQKPGFSPDYSQRQQGWMSVDYEAADWVPTAAAEALYHNNRSLLAYIGGKPGAFTSKDHTFLPGEAVEKQLIVINNSRETVDCECAWSFGLPQPLSGNRKVSIRTGEQERIPLRLQLPDRLEPGKYQLAASFRFGDGETQKDTFWVNVLPRPTAPASGAKIALFDPKGETSKLLGSLNVKFQPVDANADLSTYDLLIIGKGALTSAGPGLDVRRVRDGLKVIAFEQTANVLEKRFGFRVAEYGLREVFPRVPGHPLLAGLEPSHLHDWRGEATLLPPRLAYTLRARHGPTVSWCGIDVSRAWRCGCRGNVASVLIEKPARGDFLSILDGGYALEYSPLMEYREGKGMVLFCQMDVTGRSESDPAADALMRNILRYAADWAAQPRRQAVYVGEPAGKTYLEAAGFTLGLYAKGQLKADQVLVVGPAGGGQLAGDPAAIAAWLKSGGHLLAVGLDGAEANTFLPFKVETKKQEHIAAYFESAGNNSLLAGIGPADVHNRDPRVLPLVSGGAAILGDGILAKAETANVVFCQLAPWQFDAKQPMNQKRTFRRASCLLSRIGGNMGVAGSTPILDRFASPSPTSEKRWLTGLYLDVPEEWDDPYRFFRW